MYIYETRDTLYSILFSQLHTWFIYDFIGLFATHKYISAIKYFNYICTVNNKLILFNPFLFIIVTMKF